MVHSIFSHEVEDFDHWRNGFKKGQATRDKHGIRINGVYRGQEDPNLITVLSEADSHEAFDGMLSDPEFQQSIEDAGVKGKPNMHWMTRVN